MSLPSGLSTSDIHALLISLLYPQQTPAHLDEEFDRADKVKLALVLEHQGQVYRVLRKAGADSVRLQIQRDGSFQKMSNGPEQTAQTLAHEMGMPSFETFAWLNLWRFDDDALIERPSELDRLSDKEREVLDKYRQAQETEELDDRIKSLEGRIEEQQGALGKGAKVEEKLEQARQKLAQLRLADLSEDDLALLSQKDERFDEFDHQLDRLLRQEEEERADVEQKLPDRPWKLPLFWAGMAIGLAGLGVSIAMHETLRQVAAVNVIGFGMVAWVLLKYFTDLERASVHQVRLESIKRRLNQVREEEVTFREKISHLLIHAGVDDEHELYERAEKTRQLEQIIEQLEAKAAEVRRNPSYQAARESIAGLEDEMEDLRAERSLLPDFTMSSFQLQSDLKSMGIDPQLAFEKDEEDDEEPLPEHTFGRLKLAAERVGLWRPSGLEQRTSKMWAKICGHVLGSRFKSVELSRDGELRISNLSADQLAMWRRTRGSEERVVAAALALALQVNVPDAGNGHLETVWINDPHQEFGSSIGEAFDDVFGSAAKKSHIVLCND